LRRIAHQVESVDATCARFEDSLVRARSADDVRTAHRDGKIAALVGVEGSYGIAGHDEALDLLLSAGVTYLSPAHVFNAEAGPSNLRRREGALGDVGRELVEALRARSILVDLAHMAREPFLEVCSTANQPVIVSHTGLSALQPMWRNIDDDQIRAVAETGGVIGVIMTPRYLGRPGVDGIVDHLEHLIEIGGADIPALGSDFDGLVRPPRDLVDIAGMPLITDALLRRGHGEETIRKILGENVLRVMRG
jgi:membrane dipeptidase